MGESESNIQVDSTPATTTVSGTAPSSNSKLRDSCHACARSKVRCPKQKPSCSRCEERGTTCQYFFTRRPGRRRGTSKTPNLVNPASSNGHSNNEKTLSSISSILPTPSTPPDSNTFSMTPLSSNIPTARSVTESEGILDASDVFSTLVLGDNVKSPWRDEFGFDFSDMDFTMSAMDTPFDLSPLNTSNLAPDMNDTASLLVSLSGTPNTGTASSTKSSISSYSQILPSRAPSVAPATQGSSCSCLAIALDLLKNLSLAGFADEGNQIQASVLLAENKQSIDSVQNMMSCPSCSGDNFLFAILSMNILKIIEKYAVAARTQSSLPSNTDDHARLPNLDYSVGPDDKTPERTAAQLVLGELHRVQRLANQLSSTLKRTAEGGVRKAGTFLEILRGYDESLDENGDSMVASLSPHTLGQAESDVRKSLRSLSADIIKGLRQQ